MTSPTNPLPPVWQNVDWSNPRAHKRRSIVVSSAWMICPINAVFWVASFSVGSCYGVACVLIHFDLSLTLVSLFSIHLKNTPQLVYLIAQWTILLNVCMLLLAPACVMNPLPFLFKLSAGRLYRFSWMPWLSVSTSLLSSSGSFLTVYLFSNSNLQHLSVHINPVILLMTWKQYDHVMSLILKHLKFNKLWDKMYLGNMLAEFLMLPFSITRQASCCQQCVYIYSGISSRNTVLSYLKDLQT